MLTALATHLEPRKLANLLPEPIRETAILRLFGFAKIPLLFLTRPTVVEVSDARAEVRIPLSRMTKNHLGSMYFGVLAIGADCAGGVIAMKQIADSGVDISLIFGEFQAKFLRRPEGDVHFSCEEGAQIRELVERTIASGQRESLPVHVTATVPSKSGREPVAEFTLLLSLKRRAPRA
jgi:acyl-coenzyme A thioesterase PaaI-like protein